MGRGVNAQPHFWRAGVTACAAQRAQSQNRCGSFSAATSDLLGAEVTRNWHERVVATGIRMWTPGRSRLTSIATSPGRSGSAWSLSLVRAVGGFGAMASELSPPRAATPRQG
jgi:hypothetical protein